MNLLKKLHALRGITAAMALMALSSTVGVQAQESCYLNIHGASSVYEFSYPVEEVGKVTFSTDALTVHLTTSPGEETIPYTQLLKLTFGEQAFAGIEATPSSDFDIRYLSATHTLDIVSNTPIDCVQLYNLQGQLLHTSAPQDTHVSIDLVRFASGVYIVRATSGTHVATKKIIR